ncbi:hypothetical protein [Nonomuraea insulae]|uniref:Uncharacterized protein n=1 Tax=Nonomuraea insulae TaxID=1616787 RepID=A0ABW1CW87_9ACTN
MNRIGALFVSTLFFAATAIVTTTPAHAAAACGYYMQLWMPAPLHYPWTLEIDAKAVNSAKPAGCRVKVYTHFNLKGLSGTRIAKSSRNDTFSYSSPSPGFTVYSYSAGAAGASNRIIMNNDDAASAKLDHVETYYVLYKNEKYVKTCAYGQSQDSWCG